MPTRCVVLHFRKAERARAHFINAIFHNARARAPSAPCERARCTFGWRNIAISDRPSFRCRRRRRARTASKCQRTNIRVPSCELYIDIHTCTYVWMHVILCAVLLRMFRPHKTIASQLLVYIYMYYIICVCGIM